MAENQNDPNLTHKLDDLNQKLYSRQADQLLRRRKERPLSKVSYGIKETWEEGPKIPHQPKKNKSFSIFKKFFILALIIFLGSAIFAFWQLYQGGPTFSPENIDILIRSNSFVGSGEELALQIKTTNRNNLSLETANLIVEYQKGQTLDDIPQTAVERQKIDLEGLLVGQSKEIETNIILFGELGSRKIIKVILEYRAQGSSATFTKEETTEVVITNVPLSINVNMPTDLNVGQDLSFDLKVSSNSNNLLKNILLSIDYPSGFIFEEATPEVFSGTNVWNLGDIAPGTEKIIKIKGNLSGQVGDEQIFRFSVGEQDPTTETSILVLYNQIEESLVLSEPSLSLSFSIDGRDEKIYTKQSQNKIEPQIAWANNLLGQVEDVQIEAKILGNVLNKNSIKPKNGFYDSAIDTIIWNKETISDFAILEPGSRGSVTFEFGALSIHSPPLPIQPEITIEVLIRANRLSAGNIIQPIMVPLSKRTIRFVSNLQLTAQALYNSPSFVSFGPIPPKVGQKTNYTIIWSLTNSVSDINKGEVRAKIGPFSVAWVGQVSPETENLTYNPLTREIIWKVGEIKRGQGLTSGPREVSFVLELSPSLAQIGLAPLLLDESILTGEDSFTNVILKSIKLPLSTRLLNDPTFKPGDERVVE